MSDSTDSFTIGYIGGRELGSDPSNKSDQGVANAGVMVQPYADIEPVSPPASCLQAFGSRYRIMEGQDQVRLVDCRTDRDVTEDFHTDLIELVAGTNNHSLDGLVMGTEFIVDRLDLVDTDGDRPGLSELISSLSPETGMLLPVELEPALANERKRDNFIDRIAGYCDWAQWIQTSPGRSDLEAFHRRHKLTLMAHHQQFVKQLGRIVAGDVEQTLQGNSDLITHYGEQFMKALSNPADRGKHTNALQHAMGYLDDQVDQSNRDQLQESIQQYQDGTVPLIVPKTILNHLLQTTSEKWIHQQTYLNVGSTKVLMKNHA